MGLLKNESQQPTVPTQPKGPQVMPPPQGSLISLQSLREKLSEVSRTYSTHLKIISEHIEPLAAAREELIRIEHEMNEQVKSLQTIQKDASEIRSTMSKTLEGILGVMHGPERKAPESEIAISRSKQEYA